jgi:hypothetical protein
LPGTLNNRQQTSTPSLHLGEDHLNPRFRTSSARCAHIRAQDRRAPVESFQRGPSAQTEEDKTMLRKLAVALIAASAFAAPVLAQDTAAPKPKADAPAAAATAPAPKVVPAQPALATAKVKPSPQVRHVAHKHRKHVRVAHAKHHKHVVKAKHRKPVASASHVKAKHTVKPVAKHGVKPVRHVTRKSTTYAHSSSPAAHKSVN